MHAFIFGRGKSSKFSSLAYPRRIARTHAAMPGRLSSTSRFSRKKKSLGGIRTHSIDLGGKQRPRQSKSTCCQRHTSRAIVRRRPCFAAPAASRTTRYKKAPYTPRPPALSTPSLQTVVVTSIDRDHRGPWLGGKRSRDYLPENHERSTVYDTLVARKR